MGPQLPVAPDADLVPVMERSVALPPDAEASGRWRVGAVFAATVRFEKGELVFAIGDRFFSTRPIPGLVENSRLALQVARDASGSLVLVPLLPLAGRALARIGGVGSNKAVAPVAATPVRSSVPGAVLASPVAALAARLEVPGALSNWLLERVSSGAIQTAVPAYPELSVSDGISGWMQSVAVALSQSGLFYESKLKAKARVSVDDLKLKLLSESQGAEGELSTRAWSALDDLVRMQSAAVIAQQAGGSCYSFVVPAGADGSGWWITMQRDASQQQSSGDDEDAAQEGPWQMRLTSLHLPHGDMEIRIRQTSTVGVAITLMTRRAELAERFESGVPELSSRLELAGLNLSSWNVGDPDEAGDRAQTTVGQFAQARA
jgi:hypothetical protein